MPDTCAWIHVDTSTTSKQSPWSKLHAIPKRYPFEAHTKTQGCQNGAPRSESQAKCGKRPNAQKIRSATIVNTTCTCYSVSLVSTWRSKRRPLHHLLTKYAQEIFPKEEGKPYKSPIIQASRAESCDGVECPSGAKLSAHIW